MSLGRLILISIATIFLAGMLLYIFDPGIISNIYNLKYSIGGKPELGYFISVLESILYSLNNFTVLLIVVSTSILAGILYGSKNSVVIGVFAYIFLGIILIILYFRFYGFLFIPQIDVYLIYLFSSVLIGGASAAIPGLLRYAALNLSEKPPPATLSEAASITCPRCNEKYNSIPLICVNCGYRIKVDVEANPQTD